MTRISPRRGRAGTVPKEAGVGRLLKIEYIAPAVTVDT